MGQTISGIIIGLIVVGLIAGGFGIFMVDVNKNYNRTDFNSSELDEFDKVNELSLETQKIDNQTDVLDIDPLERADLLGGFFGSAYRALKTTKASVDLGVEMTKQAGEKTNIYAADIITNALITILLIVVIVGVFISSMVKKDL